MGNLCNNNLGVSFVYVFVLIVLFWFGVSVWTLFMCSFLIGLILYAFIKDRFNFLCSST